MLLRGALSYPLVGVVSEFSPSFDLMYVRTLSHLQETYLTGGHGAPPSVGSAGLI